MPQLKIMRGTVRKQEELEDDGAPYQLKFSKNSNVYQKTYLYQRDDDIRKTLGI
jgi:hypothetical protein